MRNPDQQTLIMDLVQRENPPLIPIGLLEDARNRYTVSVGTYLTLFCNGYPSKPYSWVHLLD